MRAFSNWDDVKPMQMGDKSKLPAGGYVCRIKQAKVEQAQRQDGSMYERLSIAFDIDEGEYSGFFADQFRESQYSDKKWKGVFRQMLPIDDGSDKDNRTKSYFKGCITAIEESNPGYKFNFDERTLDNKLVGIIFRDEEYDYNGYKGMTSKPFIMTDIHRILQNDFKVPAPKLLNPPAEPSYQPTYQTPYPSAYQPQTTPQDFNFPAPSQVPLPGANMQSNTVTPPPQQPKYEAFDTDDDLPF